MKKISTKRLVLLAMLIALQIVCSKFLMIQAAPSVRFSIDAVPVLLSGVWFGPLAGAVVGTLADMLGTMLFPTAGAWYPPLTAAFLLLGLIAGLFHAYLSKKRTFVRIALAVAVTELCACFLAKTLVLAQLFHVPFPVQLTARLFPCSVNLVADTLLVFLLDRALHMRVYNEAAPADASAPMTYEDALTYIHSVDWRGSVLGLSRIHELLSRLGSPEKKLSIIHVAGTNGKGSTSAMLAAVLEKAGYRTGLYISPYINRFNERIQLNGQSIPDAALARVTAIVKAAADGMSDPPTEFELVTAIGFYYYAEQRADAVVLEVGMGGRFDATNAIPAPALCVITNIGLDHTKILGDTAAKIAFEKAGIIKEGCNVVFYGDNAEALTVLESVCREKHAVLTVADFQRVENVRTRLESFTFDFGDIRDISMSLTGAYQLKNAAVALTAIEKLNGKGWHISKDAVREGFASVRWPGRFELLHRSPTFIADGGHNPQGVTAAVESIRLHFPGEQVTFLLGIMADKDVPEMLSIIAPVAKAFVTVTPDNPRAMPAGELADRLVALGCRAEAAPSVPAGVRRAMELAGPSGIVCALGSLYMSGDVRGCFPDRDTL